MTQNAAGVSHYRVTHHALQRTQERAELKQKQSEKFLSNALERGKTSEDFISRERRYLQAKEANGDCRVLVYRSFLFIIDAAGQCITMYAAPEWFCKARHYDGKVRIGNLKKYMRFNDIYDEGAA